ncbi:MAG: response regulator [Bdellovibrionales bacterium]|jgi:CheY-like chemotaxis protein|nr:response regulator [Bdellovibrionales bacterium]MBT3525187.1 response regulator [Bdellovibrionales bacterium]MBT7670430.1 response regulator [Bdellovibrionales bacterium]MBT7766556.1 response regulator [Bdellovibrionales bacterium]
MSEDTKVEESKKRILIVDDEPDAIEILEEILTDYNFSVISASDGAEAKDLLNTEAIDLVITDFYMPKLDGMNLIKYIRKERGMLNMPIILTSGKLGNNFNFSRNKIIFLPKPVDEDMLVKNIQQFFSEDTREFNTSYDQQLLDSCQSALSNITSALANISLQVETKLSENSSRESLTGDFISIMNSDSDQFKCTIAIAFTSNLIVQLYNKTLCEEVSEITTDVEEFAAEITNQICGSVKGDIHNCIFNSSFPMVVSGSHNKLTSFDGHRSYLREMSSAFGNATINIRVL